MTSSSHDAVISENISIAKRNVFCNNTITFILAVALSIVTGPIFDKYVYQLGDNDNTYVGLVDSINGLVSILVLGPVAVLVDSRPHSRAPLISQACAVGTFSVVAFAYSITLDQLWILYIALASNGLYYELMTSSMGALYTDSAVFLGKLQALTVRSSVVLGVGTSFGPLLSMLLLEIDGDPGARGNEKMWLWGQSGSWIGGQRLLSTGNDVVLNGDNVVLNGDDTIRSSTTNGASGELLSATVSNGNLLNTADTLSRSTETAQQQAGFLSFLASSHHTDAPAQWALSLIHKILLGGITLFVPMLITTLFFRDLKRDVDGKVFGQAESPHGGILDAIKQRLRPSSSNSGRPSATNSGGPENPITGNENSLASTAEPLLRRTNSSSEYRRSSNIGLDSKRLSHLSSENSGSKESREQQLEFHDLSKKNLVPYLVAGSDLVGAVSGGLSMKFVSLYLINQFHFSGKEIAKYQFLQAIILVGLYILFDNISKKYISRMKLSVLGCVGYITSMAMVAWIDPQQENLIYIIFFLCISLVGVARSPLDKSIVLACTDTSERGFWNALSSLTASTWGGGTFIGGYVADEYGYDSMFGFSAKLQCLALIAYLPIFWIIKDKIYD